MKLLLKPSLLPATVNHCTPSLDLRAGDSFDCEECEGKKNCYGDAKGIISSRKREIGATACCRIITLLALAGVFQTLHELCRILLCM